MSKENQQDYRERTPEEMEALRANMTKFYKKELLHVKPQADYYRLLAEIEESKVRRFAALQQGAHMFAQAEQAEQEALAKEAEVKKQKAVAATNLTSKKKTSNTKKDV